MLDCGLVLANIQSAFLFRSIKTSLIILTVAAILVTSMSVLLFSISEHEKLYVDSVESDLNGLSENMSNDLIPLLVNEIDKFELASVLLRLDRYPNIKIARVYKPNLTMLQEYLGRASSTLNSQEPISEIIDVENLSLGMGRGQSQLYAYKLIGDERLPLGYLYIATDIAGPIKQSNISLFYQVLPPTIISLLLAIFIAFWLHHKMLFPLTLLSRFAKQVELSKDYSLRADIDGKHEVAELSCNINQMMETINTEVEKNRKQTYQLIEQQKTMERLANFDSLTGLPNRQFFMENLRIELARAKRDGQDVALMFFDLDGFKTVNDSLGHETGDLLLIEVSKRVKQYLREGDLVSRLGGDEFLILLYDSPDDLMLVTIANRIIDGLKEPFSVESWELQVGVSIGIARGRDADYNLSNFVSNADIAMYRSKMAGRGSYTIFAPEMMEDNKRKLLIASSINQAIKDNEFCLHYQAKVSPEEELIGFEALIRWNSSVLGFVSPGEFIPIAEQSGKIVSVTQWVLERLCKDLPEIQRQFKGEISVSVNLSALDLKNPSLLEFINHLFQLHDVDPKLIEFEVTESAYLENFDMATHFFQSLNDVGCSIALDDFGTGYSSLSYLTQIPIHTLKIDKQFVDNLGLSDRNTLVTSTIIDMAKRLQLNICAEGVETREQFDFLVKSGCQQLQGYLFSKPTALSDLSIYAPLNN